MNTNPTKITATKAQRMATAILVANAQMAYDEDSVEHCAGLTADLAFHQDAAAILRELSLVEPFREVHIEADPDEEIEEGSYTEYRLTKKGRTVAALLLDQAAAILTADQLRALLPA